MAGLHCRTLGSSWFKFCDVWKVHEHLFMHDIFSPPFANMMPFVGIWLEESKPFPSLVPIMRAGLDRADWHGRLSREPCFNGLIGGGRHSEPLNRDQSQTLQHQVNLAVSLGSSYCFLLVHSVIHFWWQEKIKMKFTVRLRVCSHVKEHCLE